MSNNTQVRNPDSKALASTFGMPQVLDPITPLKAEVAALALSTEDVLFVLTTGEKSKGISESPSSDEIRGVQKIKWQAVDVQSETRALLQGYRDKSLYSGGEDTVKKIETMKEDQNTYEGLEVDGLIIDETRTKVGRDFYDYFYSNWYAGSLFTESFTLVIEEKVIRGSLSQITVNLNENPVFEKYVQPRTEDVESLAGEAIRNARYYLENMQEMNDRLSEEKDMYGSGIY